MIRALTVYEWAVYKNAFKAALFCEFKLLCVEFSKDAEHLLSISV